MGNKKIIAIVTILVVALLAINTFFITEFSIKNNKDTINLGSILILTNEGSSWGIASKNGIDLAVKDINDGGGINSKKLIVNHQDSQGDPTKAINAFRNLVDVQDIDIIIGTTWTPAGLALKDLARDNKVLMISPSLGVKDFNENSEFLFNTWPHDYILSKNLADLVYKEGHRKVAMIGAQQPWVKDQTIAFKSRFEELGGKVEVLVEPLPGETEVTTDALKIKNAKNIDAVVVTSGEYIIGVSVVKRIKEIGVNLPLYSVTVDNAIIEASDGAYNDMIFLTSLTPTKDFEQRYKQTFNQDIDIGADSAYDAVMMIAEAIEQTGSTNPTALQEYLNNIKEYNGVSGHLISDGKGGFTKDFVMMKVKDGKAVEVN
ncbi:MAG: ABC transporter substrate-binding protein [archaeon]